VTAAVKARLGAGGTVRTSLLFLGLFLAVLLYVQVLMPGTGGGRGTPMAVLFQAVILGGVNGLVALGLILVYRTTRIINFAATAIGAAGAELTFRLVQFTEVPFVLAVPAGLLVATAFGVAFDLAFGRRFAKAPRLVLTVVTIALAGLLAGPQVGQAVASLPFFPDNVGIADLLGGNSLKPFLPFAGFTFNVGSLNLQFGFAEIFAIDLVLLCLGLIVVFFRFTRSGVGVRAVAENIERAPLLGISTGLLSSIVWALAGLLSGVAIILTGFLTIPGAAAGVAPTVLLPALAACVIARFERIPTALLASLLISLIARATEWSYPDDLPLVSVALFFAVGAALLLQRRKGGRSESGAGVTWEATEETRPVPAELRNIGTVRAIRYAGIALGLAAVIAYPFLVSVGATVLGGVVCITTILALSVVVLTGWAGQVSLGQWGFAAVGAVVGGALTSRVGVPFWIAVPIAAAVTAAFAVLVGLPALRIRGLFLLVVTFAFAVAVNASLLNERYFGSILPQDVQRPTLFFLDFEDEKSMYFLTVLALVGSIAAVLTLRRTRAGRLLIAARENEANIQAFGINLVRTKLLAFAISGALAGLAGALYVHQQRGLNVDAFAVTNSVQLFLLTVVGGVTSVAGALLGSAYFSIFGYVAPGNVIAQFFQPFSVLLVLFAFPGGLVAMLTGVRDGVLRIIAQRRQIIVPSLFADIDPDALAMRLIPLGEDTTGGGLEALPTTERYALPSELYTGDGGRQPRGQLTTPDVPTREAAAIAAAAELGQDAPTLVPTAGGDR
jgi:branched-chain amino acid transport system permease protein